MKVSFREEICRRNFSSACSFVHIFGKMTNFIEKYRITAKPKKKIPTDASVGREFFPVRYIPRPEVGM